MPSVPLTLGQSVPFPIAAKRYALPVTAEQLALVMPTPRPGSAAVILFDETLRLMELGDSSAHLTKVERGYLPQVSGGSLQGIAPAVLPDSCAYLQTRLLVLYDLAKREHQLHMAADTMEEMPMTARWLSVEPKRIAVVVRDLTNYLDTGKADFRLRVLDMSGLEAETVGQLDMGTDGGFVWDAGHGVLVLRKDNQVQVLGPTLKGPVDHPLPRALAGLLSASMRLDRLRLHPTRPLAIFTVAGLTPADKDVGGLWRATWDEGEAKLEPLARLSPLERVKLGEFSPDGGWIFYTQTEPGPARLYAQQVVDTVGPPHLLGPLEDVKTLLWTRAPLALAAISTRQQQITRWAFPK
ncbi:hypothetical protein DRW03_22900 [Corallococcus sp. H22C18031201]|nr:hypothetical protein DRW03_22900 [Corallococcus sp. H22C18031201]